MKTFNVRYVFSGDETEYASRVQGNNEHDAEQNFRNGLRDEEVRDLTVLCVERW